MNLENCIKREHFEHLPSTQEYAKEKRREGASLLVTAERQSGGKGTKGRSFSSQVGGVYLSKLTFYSGFSAKNAFLIMASAAVAVCETLCFYGLSPVIKWANDVYVQDKKICGILVENSLSGNQISSSVVGIGLNVCNSLPAELAEIATTMQEATGKEFSVSEVRERLIAELGKERSMDEYLSFIGYMGRSATLIFGDERIPATLLSVDNEGGLTVEINGEKKRLTAAEVSLRL